MIIIKRLELIIYFNCYLMALFVNCEHLLFEKKIPDLKKKFKLILKILQKSKEFLETKLQFWASIDLSLGRKVPNKMLGSVKLSLYLF